MTDHRVFVAVAVRLIGLAILLLSAPGVLGWIFTTVQEQSWTTYTQYAAPGASLLLILTYIAYIMEPVLGLYLLLDGKWVMKLILAGLPNGPVGSESSFAPEKSNTPDIPNT